MYGTDHRWWAHWIGTIIEEQLDAELWTQEVAWPDNASPQGWGIRCYKTDTQAKGLSRDPEKIHTGSNSGYAAINHAYHLGFNRILLLGYDMQIDGDRRHWFGAHPKGLEVASNYRMFAQKFASIKPEAYGIEIWNVTRSTALTCFPLYNLDDL